MTDNLSEVKEVPFDSIREDAQYVFEGRNITKNPVQCGTTHALFCKWLLYRYNIKCEFRSIAEHDLPSHYKSSRGSDDESFLYLPTQDILIDICATPETGPYVGKNLYDLSKSHIWTVEFPEMHSYSKMLREDFFAEIHFINLGCPIELREKYALFWRG